MPATFEHVSRGSSVDVASHLGGSWRTIERIVVAPDRELQLQSGELEYACYVLAGTGALLHDGGTEDLAVGSAVTVTGGATVTVRPASSDSIELFVASIATKRE
jgi:hypothetical protein